VTSALPRVAPLTLKRRAQAFDNPDWLFDLKYDGFRALLEIDGGGLALAARAARTTLRTKATDAFGSTLFADIANTAASWRESLGDRHVSGVSPMDGIGLGRRNGRDRVWLAFALMLAVTPVAAADDDQDKYAPETVLAAEQRLSSAGETLGAASMCKDIDRNGVFERGRTDCQRADGELTKLEEQLGR
jgi:hypothetical protein